MVKDPNERLGSKNDWKEILEHPWFDSIDVDAIEKRTFKVPNSYLPDVDPEPDIDVQ